MNSPTWFSFRAWLRQLRTLLVSWRLGSERCAAGRRPGRRGGYRPELLSLEDRSSITPTVAGALAGVGAGALGAVALQQAVARWQDFDTTERVPFGAAPAAAETLTPVVRYAAADEALAAGLSSGTVGFVDPVDEFTAADLEQRATLAEAFQAFALAESPTSDAGGVTDAPLDRALAGAVGGSWAGSLGDALDDAHGLASLFPGGSAASEPLWPTVQAPAGSGPAPKQWTTPAGAPGNGPAPVAAAPGQGTDGLPPSLPGLDTEPSRTVSPTDTLAPVDDGGGMFSLALLSAGTEGVFRTPSSVGPIIFTLESVSSDYDNEVGLYEVENDTGDVGGVSPEITGTYSQKILDLTPESQRWVLFDKGSTETIILKPDAYYAFYLVQDAKTADWEDDNPDNTFVFPRSKDPDEVPHVFFSTKDANPDLDEYDEGTVHFNETVLASGVIRIAVEDLDYGDKHFDGTTAKNEPDFNDMIFTVTAAPPQLVPVCPCDCPNPGALPQAAANQGQGPSQSTSTPVRAVDGAVQVAWDDLGSTGFGTPWGQTRTWTNGAGYALNGVNGNGMVVSQMPRLMQVGDDLVAVLTGGTDAEYFELDGGVYHPLFFSQNQLSHNGTDTFTFTDTAGNQIQFHDFGGGIAAGQRGGLKSFRDAAGNLTQTTWSGGQLTETYRSQTVGGDTYTESYLYTYLSSGVNSGLLSNVTLRRKVNAGSWSTVRQVDYAYYVDSDDFGGDRDLKTATVKDGSGATLDTMYYRYYEGEGGGYEHGLKYAFGAASYARMVGASITPESASDATVDDYADYHFQFDEFRRVTAATVQGEGCSSCSGGQGTYTYAYSSSGNAPGHNSWHVKTVETLPDGNENTYFTNVYGQVMLQVFEETATGDQWIVFHEFDADGREILTALPSAVSGYDEGEADLLEDVSGNYVYLRDAAGLIYTTDYYASTDGSVDEDTAGGVAGYVANTFLQKGETGTAIEQSEFTYYLETAGGATVSPIASATVYRNSDGTGGQTVNYAYTWHSGTTAFASMTTTLPGATTSQNGPGTPDVYVSLFDTYGRTTWTRDGDGHLNYFAYDPATSALVKVIEDVNTATTADFGTLPAEFSGLRAVYYDHEALLAGTVVRFDPTVNFNWGTGSPDPALGADTFSARWSGQVTPEFSETYTFTTSADDGVRLWVNGTQIINKWSWGGAYTNTGTIALTAGQQYDIVLEFFEGFGNATAKLEWESASQVKQVVPTGRLSVPGLHLTSTYQVDALGRTTRTTLPAGNVTYATYNDPNHEMRIYAGWSGTAGTTTGPTVVLRDDRAGSYSEVLTMSATPATSGLSPNLVPTGTESIGNVQTLARTYVSAGGQVTSSREYFDLSGLTYSTAVGLGTVNTHYYLTEYGYDARGRANRTSTPNGTIYRTVYDALGRAASAWVGTDDVPTTGSWSPSNNAGANMVQTVGYVYDGGDVGDSNLTRLTLMPGGGAADRVTEYAYDFRNRLVAIKSGVEGSESTSLNRPLTYYEYDNLDQVIASELYDGDTLSITTDGNSDGVPDKPSSTYRRARTVNNFDEQGRVFRTEVYSVNQSDGSLSANTLKTDLFFDHRGNVLKVGTPGQGVYKYQYDGVGRVVKQYLSDGNGDSTWGWGAADDVLDDRVVAQTETQYDANSNPIFSITKQRFSELQSNTTGELGDPSTGVLARVSYSASYFDLADRLVSVIDVGTNGGSAYTRPGSVPSRSDTVLRTDFSYNAAGWLEDVTDPRGLITRTQYDNLGRTTRVIEGYVDGTPSAGDDRTTEYTYDGNHNLKTVKAVLPSSAYQTTEYVYGVTTGGGNGLNSNDIVALIKRPDASSGNPSSSASDQETFTVNALGETVTATDRNGTEHTYSYDVVGRLFADAVTDLVDPDVDDSILRLETAFDTAGRAYLFTSYDADSGGNVVNQVQREFNGLGQLITEYQEHGGAVNTGTSPKVQYVYSEMGSGANHSRLKSVIYPNGRQINYVYTGGWDGAIHDALSRVFQVVENANSQVLEQLGYLGVVTPVYRNHYNGVNQVFYKQSGESNGDAGDLYTGYDRFGRVAESRWRKDSNERVRIQYGHDRNGNRLYADNLVNNDFDELYHADGAANGYDTLNRLVEYQRGALSDTNSDSIPDTVSTNIHTQSWGLDAQGNFSSLTTDGTTVNRTHNAQNEILTVGAASLTYDNNGNLTTDEQGQQLIWDAWNRLVEVQDSGSTTIQVYTYDPLSRRQTEDAGTQRDFYYSAAWQVLEERVAGDTKVHYIWSPVYVDALIERNRDADGNPANGLEARGWALQDAQWNVVALADVNGTVIERYSYDAYGQRYIWDASWGTRASSSYAFTAGYQGHWHDTTTGNVLIRYRWHRPPLGRPIQEDQQGFAAGRTNLYVWIGNNPVNGLDPTGQLFFIPVIIVAVAIVVIATPAVMAPSDNDVQTGRVNRINEQANRAANSEAMNLMPGVGVAKSVPELLSGKDAITGEPVPWWASAINIALSAIGASGAIKKMLPKSPLVESAENICETIGKHDVTRLAPSGRKTIPNPGIQWGKGIEAQGIPWEDYLAKLIPGNRLPKGFKAFDFFDRASGVATSAKTLDTATAARIADPKKVYSKLVGHIDDAADFTEYTLKGTTVEASQITARELQVAVPKATTAAQWEQINQAVQYGQGKGVTVKVTMVE